MCTFRCLGRRALDLRGGMPWERRAMPVIESRQWYGELGSLMKGNLGEHFI